MKLTLREVATMFDASESTVERWIKNDGMPHHRVRGQVRFHRAEILEWANKHSIRIAAEPPESRHGQGERASFADALATGGVHYDVRASDRESLLRAVIERSPLSADMDRELLFDIFLARENVGTTGIGDGIAIPHVRSPIVAHVEKPAVTLCFLAEPVDFAAIDGKPVHTVFTIVTPTIRLHLTLLARLSAALHEPTFRSALADRAPPERLIEAARHAEERFGHHFDDSDEGAPAP